MPIYETEKLIQDVAPFWSVRVRHGPVVGYCYDPAQANLLAHLLNQLSDITTLRADCDGWRMCAATLALVLSCDGVETNNQLVAMARRTALAEFSRLKNE